MRISINLATRPFVELRPLFARLRVAMAALALTAIALGIGLHLLNARAHTAQAQMDALKAQTLTAQIERQTNEARMSEPQNRAVLERSTFLNNLFARKSFSWTSVMMDLERVLPGGVQVTSIEPAITAGGNVNIRLRVTGNRDLAVDLVRNLELSQRFLFPHLANETAQAKEPGSLMRTVQIGVPGGVEFDIMSGYNPLPESTKDRDSAQTAQAQGDSAKTIKAQINPASQSKPTGSPSQQTAAHPGTGHKAIADHKPVAGRKSPPAAASGTIAKPSANGGPR
jgi:type IV pilus assembly protein PilN